MKHIRTFESFVNEAQNLVTFSVDDDKLDQMLNARFSRQLDYKDDKGDSYYVLPKRDFDNFIDLADSSGFDVDYEGSEDSVVYVIESFMLKMNEGYMSELDIIRQESKTLEEFIKKGKAAFPKIAKMHHADDFFKELWNMGQQMKEGLNESTNRWYNKMLSLGRIGVQFKWVSDLVFQSEGLKDSIKKHFPDVNERDLAIIFKREAGAKWDKACEIFGGVLGDDKSSGEFVIVNVRTA